MTRSEFLEISRRRPHRVAAFLFVLPFACLSAVAIMMIVDRITNIHMYSISGIVILAWVFFVVAFMAVFEFRSNRWLLRKVPPCGECGELIHFSPILYETGLCPRCLKPFFDDADELRIPDEGVPFAPSKKNLAKVCLLLGSCVLFVAGSVSEVLDGRIIFGVLLLPMGWIPAMFAALEFRPDPHRDSKKIVLFPDRVTVTFASGETLESPWEQVYVVSSVFAFCVEFTVSTPTERRVQLRPTSSRSARRFVAILRAYSDLARGRHG